MSASPNVKALAEKLAPIFEARDTERSAISDHVEFYSRIGEEKAAKDSARENATADYEALAEDLGFDPFADERKAERPTRKRNKVGREMLVAVLSEGTPLSVSDLSNVVNERLADDEDSKVSDTDVRQWVNNLPNVESIKQNGSKAKLYSIVTPDEDTTPETDESKTETVETPEAA